MWAGFRTLLRSRRAHSDAFGSGGGSNELRPLAGRSPRLFSIAIGPARRHSALICTSLQFRGTVMSVYQALHYRR